MEKKPWNYDPDRVRKALNQLKDRYFRPVIAFPEGHLTHHGNCSIHRSIAVYGTAACTCGFLHDLQWLPGYVVEKLYPNYLKEIILEDGPPVERSEEEKAEMQAMFDKAFPVKIGPSVEEWEQITQQEWTLIEEVFGSLFRQRKEADWLALDNEGN